MRSIAFLGLIAVASAGYLYIIYNFNVPSAFLNRGVIQTSEGTKKKNNNDKEENQQIDVHPSQLEAHEEYKFVTNDYMFIIVLLLILILYQESRLSTMQKRLDAMCDDNLDAMRDIMNSQIFLTKLKQLVRSNILDYKHHFENKTQLKKK